MVQETKESNNSPETGQPFTIKDFKTFAETLKRKDFEGVAYELQTNEVQKATRETSEFVQGSRATDQTYVKTRPEERTLRKNS